MNEFENEIFLSLSLLPILLPAYPNEGAHKSVTCHLLKGCHLSLFALICHGYNLAYVESQSGFRTWPFRGL